VELRFVAPDLRALDATPAEVLAVSYFDDERPLRGLAGLIDFRLAGQLSKLLIRGRVHGAVREQVLLPGRPRLACDRVLLVGLGRRDTFDVGRARTALVELFATLDALMARSVVLCLPGRSDGSLDVEPAIESFLPLTDEAHEQDDVTLVEPPEAVRAMRALIERHRRRVRAAET